ncbi:BnaA09g08570D [Brassica napus]|uniref:BnaA09g08570D protein n=1 Tax=Brassica napus TaxID=3708 RepID=A0A078HHM2_BRANA|nr:BnaA09g08570D [Brassica napus]
MKIIIRTSTVLLRWLCLRSGEELHVYGLNPSLVALLVPLRVHRSSAFFIPLISPQRRRYFAPPLFRAPHPSQLIHFGSPPISSPPPLLHSAHIPSPPP